jgi:hypothetical protein
MSRLGGSSGQRHLALGCAVVSAAILLSARARADVVMGPPPLDDCPDGTRGSACFGHGTDVCVPDRCSSDDDCDTGQSCEELALCIGEHDCGGGETSATVEGRCEEGACSEGTCERIEVCTGGCDCDVSGPGSAGATPALLLLGACWMASRLRRRRGGPS